ncbi:ATP-binding protein [Hufsiella ginkgonis]|uniref:histidine kinase n=1 Tax=Hufsiella ginkgonis TaxID=2695274 RepID=A0A7K1XYD4_9SPHI|nr:ATP-binding protein [Hufsiella ginkgonis]MXV16014.1 response regulator [Hufsiella ginkgonis]
MYPCFKILKRACCCFFLLVLSGTASGYLSDRPGVPVAENGVIDLRGEKFGNEIALNGQWEFYWRRLLDPASSVKGKRELVDFPAKWNGSVYKGERLGGFGYATYKVRVLLPHRSERLSLTMPDVYSSYKLFINGKEMAANGVVATTVKDFVPHWEYHAVNIEPGTDTLDLVLQIANFVHSSGGINKPLTIGQTDAVDLLRRQGEAIDLLLTGCLFMGGLFFLGLYLLGNRDKAILLFSLYSMVYSYRIVGVDNYVLHSLLPGLSWQIAVRLEYITLFTGIGLFGLYTRHLYPEDINKLIVKGMLVICVTFSLATLLLAPVYFTRLINPFLLFTLFCLVYIPYVYTQAYKRRRPGAIYSLISTVALMSIFAISLFHYWGFIPALQLLSFLCYVSFFFLQSLVLSHRVSFTLKKARAQAEQGLTAKSEFLSTMSHEIRTPLNSVIGMSHLLLKNDPRPDQVAQLDVMLFSANNLLAIVNDILDYNKIEAGKISFEHIEMDLVSITRNIVMGLQGPAQDKGIELKLQVDNALQHKLLGDPTRIFQVISNLVHNAIKFTQKGYVEIGIAVQAETERTITLRIRVKDTGIGISREKQKLIFERFTQADSSTSRGFGGTGLGLAICKRILELQHSSLQLQSDEGIGSEFFFVQTFEKSIRTRGQETRENSLPKEEDKPLTGVCILLVEDNPMNVLVAQSFLKKWGAATDVAQNGREALDKLDTDRHKLVLMDLHMPLMDGYEASKRMRASGVTIPIIALTANLPNEIEQEVTATGINDIVVKPFLPDELYRKVLHYVVGRMGNGE